MLCQVCLRAMEQGTNYFHGSFVQNLYTDNRHAKLREIAAKDVLLVRKRVDHLAERKRTPRSYKKQNSNY